MSKVNFLVRVLRAYVRHDDASCPHCGRAETALIARKKLILHLRKCSGCGLMFRWPKDSSDFNRTFYQSEYKQAGLTTDLPNLDLLQELERRNFKGTEKDFNDKIAVLKALVPRGKVLDFGCSWGYGAFQLRRAGYDAVGFEISRPRAAFGRRHLGVSIIEDYAALDAWGGLAFDAIFCSHTLEHLSSLAGVFERLSKLLKPNGLLALFVPNCGGTQAQKLGVRWGAMICERHTMAFDRRFFECILPRHGFAVKAFSEPYDPVHVKAVMTDADLWDEPNGDELMILATKTGGASHGSRSHREGGSRV